MNTELCQLNVIFNSNNFHNGINNINDLDCRNEFKIERQILQLYQCNLFERAKRSLSPYFFTSL